MGREGRDYWEAQLSEYWDSGLTIQEYSELKELPYESTRRWIRVLQKARNKFSYCIRKRITSPVIDAVMYILSHSFASVISIYPRIN